MNELCHDNEISKERHLNNFDFIFTPLLMAIKIMLGKDQTDLKEI